MVWGDCRWEVAVNYINEYHLLSTREYFLGHYHLGFGLWFCQCMLIISSYGNNSEEIHVLWIIITKVSPLVFILSVVLCHTLARIVGISLARACTLVCALIVKSVFPCFHISIKLCFCLLCIPLILFIFPFSWPYREKTSSMATVPKWRTATSSHTNIMLHAMSLRNIIMSDTQVQ